MYGLYSRAAYDGAHRVQTVGYIGLSTVDEMMIFFQKLSQT